MKKEMLLEDSKYTGFDLIIYHALESHILSANNKESFFGTVLCTDPLILHSWNKRLPTPYKIDATHLEIYFSPEKAEVYDNYTSDDLIAFIFYGEPDEEGVIPLHSFFMDSDVLFEGTKCIEDLYRKDKGKR